MWVSGMIALVVLAMSPSPLESLVRAHLGDAELKTCLTASPEPEHVLELELRRVGGAVRFGVTELLSGDYKVSNCINRMIGGWLPARPPADEKRAFVLTSDPSRAQLGFELVRELPAAPPRPDVSFTLVGGSEGARGYRDGAAADARFDLPLGLAARDGVVYVADSENRVLRAIDVAHGEVRTVLAFPAWEMRDHIRYQALRQPSALAFDPGGRLYVLDALQGTIWRVDGAQITPVFQSLDGGPRAMVFDRDGTVLLADSEKQRVVRVDLASGALAVVADKLDRPEGLALDGKGHLFVSEWGKADIVEVTLATGARRRFARAGGGSLASDGTYLYLAESRGAVVRRFELATGKSMTFGGKAHLAHYASAGLGEMPFGLALDGGEVFLADSGNDVIRRIAPSGDVTTLAGRVPEHRWRALTRASDGTLYATAGEALYRVDGPGRATLVAGHPTEMGHRDGAGGRARFRGPIALAALSDGSLIVGEVNGEIRRVDPRRGTVETIADLETLLDSIAVDAHDNVYAAAGGKVTRIAPDRRRTVIPYGHQASAMVIDGDTLYALDDQAGYGELDGIVTALRAIDLRDGSSRTLAFWKAAKTRSETWPMSRGLAMRRGLWIAHGNGTVSRFDPATGVERAVFGDGAHLVAEPDGLLVVDGGAIRLVSIPR